MGHHEYLYRPNNYYPRKLIMLQLNPGEQYKFSRVLKDPSDTDTHYVKAVFYNAYDASVISSVSMTDKGGRIFIGSWEVPNFPDASYVFVTTTVYDDASYSTVNGNYAVETNEILVSARWSHAFGGGGGGGSSIDYKKIRAIFAELAVQIIADLPKPNITVKAQDLGLLADKLMGGFERMIKQIEMPEALDLSPISSQLELVMKQLQSRPTFEKTDLSGLAELVQSVAGQIADTIENMPNVKVDMPEIQDVLIEAIAQKLRDEFNGGSFKFSIGDMSNLQMEKKPTDNSPRVDRYKNLLLPRK